MTYAPPRGDLAQHTDATSHRNVTKWTVALVLFVTFLAFLAALNAFLITTEGPSERTLRRALAVISEVDVLLDRHYEDLRQRAESAGAGEHMELQDFPVRVPLTSDEVRSQSRDELRETLLDRGADTLYDDGTGAMRAESSTGDVAVFSVGGSIDRSLNLLRADVHLAMGILALVLGIVSLLLAALLAAATRGFGRLLAPASVVLVASALAAVVLWLSRLSLDTSGSDEYVKAEFLDIAREVSWLPTWNAAILTAASAVVVVAAAVAARTTDTRRKHAGDA